MGLVAGDDRRSNNLPDSSTSTVLLDPVAFLQDWKKQIKGKDSIPANQQRLTFTSHRISKKTPDILHWSKSNKSQIVVSATVGELLEDLLSWHAILHSDSTSAKLLRPLVLTEGDELALGLYSRTAQELRQIGVPCNVFYLSFDKWIPAWHFRGPSEDLEENTQLRELHIEVDQEFQYKNFNIDLYGQLNGESLPFPFSYHMSGKELATKISMLEQTVQYRWEQKMRHQLTTPALKDSQKGSVHSLVDGEICIHNQNLSLGQGDYLIHCEKNREFTAIISKEFHQLRCIVLTVITVPLVESRCLKGSSQMQSVKRVSGGERRKSRSNALISVNRNPAMLTLKSMEEASHSVSDPKVKDYCCIQDNSSRCHVVQGFTMSSGLDESDQVSTLPDEKLDKRCKKKKKRKNKRISRANVKSVIASNYDEGPSQDGIVALNGKNSEDVYNSLESSKDLHSSNNVGGEVFHTEPSILADAVSQRISPFHDSLFCGEKGLSEQVTDLGCDHDCVEVCLHFKEMNKKISTVEMIDTDLFKTNLYQEDNKCRHLKSICSSFCGDEPVLCSLDCTSDSRRQETGVCLSELAYNCVDNTCTSTTVLHKGTPCSENDSCIGDEPATIVEVVSSSVNEIIDDMGGENSGNVGKIDCSGKMHYFPASEDLRGDKGDVSSTVIDNSESERLSGAQSSVAFDSHNDHHHRRNVGKRYGPSGVNGICMSNGSIASNDMTGVFTNSGKENNQSVWLKSVKSVEDLSKGVNSLAVESTVGKSAYKPHIRGHSKDILSGPNFSSASSTQGDSLMSNDRGHEVKKLGKCHDFSSQSYTCQNHINGEGIGKQSPTHSRWGDTANKALHPQVKERLYVENRHSLDAGKSIRARKQLDGDGDFVHKMVLENQHSLKGNNVSSSKLLRHAHGSCQETKHQHLDLPRSGSAPSTHGYEEASSPCKEKTVCSCMTPSFSLPQSSIVNQSRVLHSDVSFREGNRIISEFQSFSEDLSFHPSLLKGLKLGELDRCVQQEKIGEREVSSQHFTKKWVAVESKFANADSCSLLQAKSQTDVLSTCVEITAPMAASDYEKGKEVHSCNKPAQRADVGNDLILRSYPVIEFPEDNCSTPHRADDFVGGGFVTNPLPFSHVQGIQFPSASFRLMDGERDGDVKPIPFSNSICEANESKKDDNKVAELSTSLGCDKSSEQELRQLAREVLKAIHASCESRKTSESIAAVIGAPLGEFEKVIQVLAPTLHIAPTDLLSRSGSCCIGGEEAIHKGKISRSICRHRLVDVELSTIWKWYQDPSCYGLGVKAVDHKRSSCINNPGNQFQAFFVPYLSGLQLFGYSSGLNCSENNNERSYGIVKKDKDFSSLHFGNLPILSTLLPKHMGVYDLDAHQPTELKAGNSPREGKQEDNMADCEMCGCQFFTEGLEFGDIHLLYEFFDGEKPQQRRPFFDRMKELEKGEVSPDSYSSGDPSVLDCLKLGELHPASWFSVAWYPIYRIPDGTFRAAFLTYHSLSHFSCGCSSTCGFHGFAECSINKVVAPVVGLMSYNAQAEHWFSLTQQSEIENLHWRESSDLYLSQVQQRLGKLEAAAAAMAKGSCDQSSMSQVYKHADYRFFASRQR